MLYYRNGEEIFVPFLLEKKKNCRSLYFQGWKRNLKRRRKGVSSFGMVTDFSYQELWHHLIYQGNLYSYYIILYQYYTFNTENHQHFILQFLKEHKYSNVAIRKSFKRLQPIAVSFHGNEYEINHYLKTNVSLLILGKSAD